jgi:hypothetical protein
MNKELCVESRRVINLLKKKMRMRLLPFFQCLDRRHMAEILLRDMVVIKPAVV